MPSDQKMLLTNSGSSASSAFIAGESMLRVGSAMKRVFERSSPGRYGNPSVLA